MNKDKVMKDIEEIETLNMKLDHRVSKLIAENEHLKQTYKQLYDSIKPTRIRSKEQCDALHSKLNANFKLLYVKCNGCILSDNHDLCVLDFINNVNARDKSKSVKKISKRKVWKPTGKVFTNIGYTWRPTSRTFTIVGNACLLTRITTTTEVSLRKPNALESDIPKPVVTLVYSRKPRKSKTNVHISKPKIIKSISANKKEPSKSWGSIVSDVPSSSFDKCRSSKFFSGTVKFGNDHMAKILGYGDYHIGNVTISSVYYVEGLGHNLFSIRQLCDSNLEVSFRQHTCFIRNLEGVDLLTGSQGNNLYTLSLGDMMASSPICLLLKASKTKSWIWHQCLSHLNFGAINHLARQGLVRGLPKLKFEKDYLCSACAMGKSKKKPHKPKFEDACNIPYLSDPMDTPMVEKSKLDKDPQGKAVDPKTIVNGFSTLYVSLYQFNFIKEQVENGVVELYFVDAEYHLADIFTKALGREGIEFLINKLGMRSFTPETLKQLADEAEEYQNWRDLPKDISLDSVVVLRYEKRSKSKIKGKVSTEMELVLEQTQHGNSYEVSVSAEGVEELKRKVKIKGEKKEALLTLRQKLVESLQPVETLQWENILTVGSSSNSGNHSTNSGNPLAFYSQQSSPKLDTSPSYQVSRIK
ncbi:integrase, catalytic region, zinc finger, CCHC-type containing protein [Tanacetum coccineum]